MQVLITDTGKTRNFEYMGHIMRKSQRYELQLEQTVKVKKKRIEVNGKFVLRKDYH